jgi:hypothetical protein
MRAADVDCTLNTAPRLEMGGKSAQVGDPHRVSRRRQGKRAFAAGVLGRALVMVLSIRLAATSWPAQRFVG